jgi:hypothetical protein
MKKKQGLMLIASLLAASSLGVVFLEGAGADFLKAASESTYYCASIVFGTAEYSNTSGVAVSDFTETNISVSSISESTYCYAVSGSAARIGKASNQGILTFDFSSSVVITRAQVCCYRYGTDSSENCTFSLATSASSADNFKAVSATSVSDLTSYNLDFTGLDGGTGASSSSLTVKSTDVGRIDLCKILLTITGVAPNGDYIGSSAASEKTLSSLSVTSAPSKTTYTKGEALDTTGLVITADYSDNSSADVTSSCTFSPLNGAVLNTVGTQTVYVSYTEGGVTKTTSFAVVVSAQDVTLSSIAVTTQPNTTIYTVGDILNTTGLVVTGTYSDGSTANVTSSCSFSPTTLSTSGTQTITVSYSGKTTTFNVTVNAAKTLASISISGTASTTSYTVGDAFNATGLTVTATYSDGSTSDVTSSVSWTPASLSASDTAVTASYTYGGVTKTATYSGITVTAASGNYMYTKKAGDHLQIFAIEQTNIYGDATLFKYGNFEILIDGGNTYSQAQLKHYLETYCTDHVLDVLILTHPHNDHYGAMFKTGTYEATSGGTIAAAGVTSVTKIVDSGYDGSATEWTSIKSYYENQSPAAEFSTISSLTSGHVHDAIWQIAPQVSIQWLYSSTYATDQSSTGQNTYNNNSVLCDLHFGTYEYVMLGDAQSTEVNAMISAYSSQTFITAGDTVVFKACHHCSGSADSGNTKSLMDFLSPSYGWASGGISSSNGANKVSTPATKQHPYKNGATSITNKTGTANFYWNGSAGTLDITLDESFANFTIGGEGRVYGYGYKMSGTLVDANSEKTTPLFSTQWATTSAFVDGAGSTLGW